MMSASPTSQTMTPANPSLQASSVFHSRVAGPLYLEIVSLTDHGRGGRRCDGE